jgi:hypothetical protein
MTAGGLSSKPLAGGPQRAHRAKFAVIAVSLIPKVLIFLHLCILLPHPDRFGTQIALFCFGTIHRQSWIFRANSLTFHA